MGRDLHATMLAALTASVVYPVYLVEGLFASGPLRIWNGVGNLSWDSKTWTGAGTLLGINPVRESTSENPGGITVTLSGIPTEIISLALTEQYQGRPLKVWFALRDDLDSTTLIANPYELFSGRMDTMPIQEGPETVTVGVEVDNHMVGMNRANASRQTFEDHQRLYPGDTGFRYVEYVTRHPIRWGIPGSTTNAGGGGKIGGGRTPSRTPN